jgi:protein involved in polysaccharide export with SLBB domain
MEMELETKAATGTAIPTSMGIAYKEPAMKSHCWMLPIFVPTFVPIFVPIFVLILLLTFAVSGALAQPHAPMSMSTSASVSPGTPGGSGFGSGAAGPIGAGDLVEMSVFDTPELSGKLRVSNTGEVVLPLVGRLQLAGMKAEEAASLIRQKLVDGRYLQDPQVTVFIAEYATQNVSVVGEVRSPGIYPAFGAHHLLDYLSAAAGLTPLAATNITIAHAGKPGEPERVKMTAGATPKPENNPEILPGDTIFVERTGIIYVVGDVAHPGGFPMDHEGELSGYFLAAFGSGADEHGRSPRRRGVRALSQRDGLQDASLSIPTKRNLYTCRTNQPRMFFLQPSASPDHSPPARDRTEHACDQVDEGPEANGIGTCYSGSPSRRMRSA